MNGYSTWFEVGHFWYMSEEHVPVVAASLHILTSQGAGNAWHLSRRPSFVFNEAVYLLNYFDHSLEVVVY